MTPTAESLPYVLFQRECHLRPQHADLCTDHPEGDFDHELYCQVPRTGLPQMARWQESERLALTFSKPGKAAQLIVGDAHVYRRALVGKLKNEDIMLATA